MVTKRLKIYSQEDMGNRVETYVRNILELPTVRKRNVKEICEFYETLLFNVESLRTLKSLSKLNTAVRFTFDKLDVIKNELAMIDENWCEWTFVEFLEALEKWKINNNNPISNEPKSKSSNTRTIVFSDVFYCFFSFVILERETDAGAYQRFLVSN